MSGFASFDQLLDALGRPSALVELAVLAACIALAWALVHATRKAAPGSIWYGERGIDGVLFPLLILGGALLARALLMSRLPIALLKLAVPVLVSLAVIRIVVRVLKVAFPQSRVMRVFERTVSWLVWLALVLWITDLLPLALAEMEALRWRIGGTEVSLRSILEGILTAGVVLVIVLWLSAAIEARLLAATGVNLSVRKIAANATRAGLLLVGLLIALSAAGIPLGALSVFGGALGVGLGFGLQKLAANYVSGFVILAERSMRIGDLVKVDNFEGRITDITTRYTVIRAHNGREAIVPNELMITQRVENGSFTDRNIAQTSTVQVAYGTDLDALLPRLEAAVGAAPRVLADPPCAVQLSAFAADGLELTIVFWIGDPENGLGNVRSDVNLAVLKLLEAAGVEIPYPQRVLHDRAAPPALGRTGLPRGAPAGAPAPWTAP